MKLFNKRIFQGLSQLMLLAMLSLTGPVQAEPPLDIATTPLANSGPTIIKPNMLYVLDDSGSMGWDFMPDWTSPGFTSHPGESFHNDSSYNAVTYNPAVRYDPPAYYTSAGAIETTTYPTQDGTSVARGGDGSATANWKRVKHNAYSGTGTNDLETGGVTYKGVEASNPQYTVSIANEFCTKTDLRECVSSLIPTNSHPYPARIRWCSSAAVAANTALPADNACQSVRTGAFINMRVPIIPGTPPAARSEATITFTNAWNTPSIDRIFINGQQIMSWSTWSNYTNNENTIASKVETRIDQCTNSAIWNCTVSGYKATANGNVVTIYAPGTVTGTPSVTYSSGGITASATPFALPNITILRDTIDIVRADNSYHYPGTTVKHSVRTDCIGATCTYNEEMENYANWYTYYRTRMQMMKTSTSLAFKDVGDDFRMGFMTINANEALNFADFSGSAKAAWYTTLLSVTPGGITPLRQALANAGRLYAGRYTQGSKFSDPVQYECQDNFTLLTTDGKWNDAAGVDINNNAMTDQDNDASEKGKYQGAVASSHTLADIAKYYRDTDLRTGALGNCTGALGSGVCETAGTTPAPNQKQSMVTFTLGLGVDGTLAYDINYGPTVPGDFKEIYDGNLPWPTVISNDETTFDDLWHAAVNGDGRYFSAKKTQDLIDQLREAIALIKVKTGAGAAAATSTLNPVSGDNFAYVASYTSGLWIGNLEKREIDITTGEINKAALACVEDVVPENNCASPSTIVPDGSGGYSCDTAGVTPAVCTGQGGNLVGTVCSVTVLPTCFGALKTQLQTAPRTVYFNNAGTLSPFATGNLSAAQLTNFASGFVQTQLTQGSSYTAAQVPNLTEDNLVNYIKGDKTYEQSAALDDNQLFRNRTAILGDLIDSKPSFIGAPTFNYGDSGYQAFKAANLSRAGTVYVGSNDGMLHAFDSDTLTERWAYVPSVVIPNLWKLADSNYSSKHSYYVNGDVTISDICVASDCATATASDWKTILVAGLDGGGRGYYALDITNPTLPTLLWEIDPSDAGFNNLGYTYGNPIVTKRSGDGKWVVAFTSGYNNIPDNNAFYSSPASSVFKPNLTPQFNTGNGQGYLYVVDAKAGNSLATIATGVGSQASPSGLGKMSAYADFGETNNTATYLYGGDLNGDVWRFNIEAGVNSVLHFAALKDALNVGQPIMTPVGLGEINNKKVIIIGTGKYLEASDLDATSFSTQSLYALKDVANDGDPEPVYNNPRSVAGIVNQTAVPNSDPSKSDERVSGTSNGVNFVSGPGWYLDFPDSGERQNVASQLVLGTLLVPTTVPTASACQPAGYGWFNFFDYRTGLAVLNGSGAVSQRTTAPSVGFNVVFIDGKPKVSNVQADNPNPNLLGDVPFDLSPDGFQEKRSIWREIVD